MTDGSNKLIRNNTAEFLIFTGQVVSRVSKPATKTNPSV